MRPSTRKTRLPIIAAASTDLPPPGPMGLFRYQDADEVGINDTAAQPWFPTNGSAALGIGVYQFWGRLFATRSAGVASHITSVLFQGGATVGGDISYNMLSVSTPGPSASAPFARSGTAFGALAIAPASTDPDEQIELIVLGVLQTVVAGNFSPRFKYSAAPGGAPTIKKGTFFRLLASPAAQGEWV